MFNIPSVKYRSEKGTAVIVVLFHNNIIALLFLYVTVNVCNRVICICVIPKNFMKRKSSMFDEFVLLKGNSANKSD